MAWLRLRDSRNSRSERWLTQRALIGFVAVGCVVAAQGACSSGSDNGAPAGLETSRSPTSAISTIPAKPGSSPTNPLPQPVTPDVPPGWEAVTASDPELGIDPIIPAQWNPRVAPGQSWARIRIQGSFVDTQATNGQPRGLVPLFRLIGSKGKQYPPVQSVGYGPSFAGYVIERLDLLSEQEPVVAPAVVSGFSYFLVDTNDTGLRPMFMDFSGNGEALWLGPPP